MSLCVSNPYRYFHGYNVEGSPIDILVCADHFLLHVNSTTISLITPEMSLDLIAAAERKAIIAASKLDRTAFN